MRFNRKMLTHWQSYKATVREYELGIIPAEVFLLAHAEWNDAVAVFERECSATSNYGAF